ncbi:hypothetical protein KKKH21_03540 [Helicobacter pylori]
MKKTNINILIACEESQRVCNEFRKLGFNAYSCDLLECSGGHPEWHFNCDVFEVIENKGGVLQNGKHAKVSQWDMMIAHPPCTFLAVSGASGITTLKIKISLQNKKDLTPNSPTAQKTERKL